MPPASRGSRRDFAALEARRFEAARLFARGASQVTVARTLGATRAAAHRWFHAWQDEGRTALKTAGRAGRKPRLEAPQLARVEAALLKGPGAHGFATELWTLPRVATLIERLTHVRYHPGHVWYILRRLGWSLQRPTRQAPRDAPVSRSPTVVADGRTTAWLCAGTESRRADLGQPQDLRTCQPLPRRHPRAARAASSRLRPRPPPTIAGHRFLAARGVGLLT